MSTEATLTSKGQTTIPKNIRDGLRMKTGDRMTFTLMPDGVVIMRVKNKHVGGLAGLLQKRAGNLYPLRCCRGNARPGHRRPRSVSGS